MTVAILTVLDSATLGDTNSNDLSLAHRNVINIFNAYWELVHIFGAKTGAPKVCT